MRKLNLLLERHPTEQVRFCDWLALDFISAAAHNIVKFNNFSCRCTYYI